MKRTAANGDWDFEPGLVDVILDVEVAHEALIREWPTLRGWLQDDRIGLRIHHRLTETATERGESGRNPEISTEARGWTKR